MAALDNIKLNINTANASSAGIAAKGAFAGAAKPVINGSNGAGAKEKAGTGRGGFGEGSMDDDRAGSGTSGMIKKPLSPKRKTYIGTMTALMWICSLLTCGLVVFILAYVLFRGIPNISWQFVSTSPSYLSGNIGILPDIMNTIYIVLASLIIVLHHRICGRDPFRHPLHHLRTCGNAVLLPVHGAEDLAPCGCADPGHHEPSHHHANHSGEP